MLLVYIILGCRHELYSTVSAFFLSLSLSPSFHFLPRERNASTGIAPCGKLLRNPRGFIRSRLERKKFIQIQLRSDFGQDISSSLFRRMFRSRNLIVNRRTFFFSFFCSTKYRTYNLIIFQANESKRIRSRSLSLDLVIAIFHLLISSHGSLAHCPINHAADKFISITIVSCKLVRCEQIKDAPRLFLERALINLIHPLSVLSN